MHRPDMIHGPVALSIVLSFLHSGMIASKFLAKAALYFDFNRSLDGAQTRLSFGIDPTPNDRRVAARNWYIRALGGDTIIQNNIIL